jgi:CMP-N-acetylneuraminic acid synthetase
MRHSSERVPGKNHRLFCGKPLFTYILRSLSACPMISRIVVDTDSPTIKDVLTTTFPHVTIIDRPAHLTTDDIPMNEVLLHDVSLIEADFYLQTHCTNPLLRKQTISSAIEMFLEKLSTHDSLFSVTRSHVRLWDALCRAINHNPSILLRTQDLPPVYEENSCLYIFSRPTLEQTRNRIGQRPLMFEIERREALDIDEEVDFELAEFLYHKYYRTCRDGACDKN